MNRRRTLHAFLPALALMLLSPAAKATLLIDEVHPGGESPPDARGEVPDPATAAPAEANARPKARFGQRGQIAIFGTSNGGYVVSRAFSGSDAKIFDAALGIGVDYFVLRNFSLGIDLGVEASDAKLYGAATFGETKLTHLEAGVRLGVNVPLGDVLSWYPRLSLGLASNHWDTRTLATDKGASAPPPSLASQVGPWINVYAPLLVHPVPNFFVGLGPRVEHDFGVRRGGAYDGSQYTVLGADVVIGGWWGGARERDAATSEGGNAADAAPRAPRFGDKGHVVLTAATSGSVAQSSYSKSDASAFGVTVAPGFDYFTSNHVSVGLDIAIDASSATTLDSSGTKSVSSSVSFGVAPRLGVEVPIGEAVSLYPRAEVGFGGGEGSTKTATFTNEHSISRTWVGLDAPVLVHGGTHFFVGAGPYLSVDLANSDQTGHENKGTLLGVKLVLGGWI